MHLPALFGRLGRRLGFGGGGVFGREKVGHVAGQGRRTAALELGVVVVVVHYPIKASSEGILSLLIKV